MSEKNPSYQPEQSGERRTLVPYYHRWIVETLTHSAEGNQDWASYTEVLEEFGRTFGDGRDDFVGATGQVISEAQKHPGVSADALHIATYGLDLAEQVAPAVEYLETTPMRDDPVVGPQIRTYRMYIAARNRITDPTSR